MSGSHVVNCQKCGKLIFTWTEVCPYCEANQDEWEAGERIVNNEHRKENQ